MHPENPGLGRSPKPGSPAGSIRKPKGSHRSLSPSNLTNRRTVTRSVTNLQNLMKSPLCPPHKAEEGAGEKGAALLPAS